MKKVLYILLFLGLILAVLSLFYVLNRSNKYSQIQKTLSEWKIAGYDMRLFKYYFSTKNMNRDGVINLAKSNCYKVVASTDLKIQSAPYYQYQRSLKEKLMARIDLDVKNSQGLLFMFDEVPDTDKCWLVWMVDTKGKGLVGYENQDSEIQIFNSNLAKDKLDNILNRINKL